MGALADLISNPGAGGYEFEADLLSPNYIPKSKLVYGADGSATDVTPTTPWPIQLRNTSGTEIGTNANPVQIGDGGGSVTVDGAVTVSGTVAVSGTVTANESQPSTATRSSVAGSASSVTIIAANATRRGLIVYNDSTAILYLALGTGPATSTDFSYKMFPEDCFEIPFPACTAILVGIWASATGAARVTELT